jgi:Tol biopolymer transport system component
VIPAPEDARRWRRIEAIYSAAAEQPAALRRAFLDRECSGDLELRHEVESLLHASDEADGFLSPEHLGKHISEMSESATLIGTTFGRYDIISLLGSGASGVVYLAKDRELGRHSAIKILTNPMGSKEDGLRRFVREARAASALNHPNIVTVYEVGEVQGKHFLATEFVDGGNLRTRLRSGALPILEALDIAAQCAAALEVAHQAEIIHRDVKPENVMVRPDGLVKIVDFGLARFADPNASASISPTLAGVVLGTLRYMSPEQMASKPLDARTDIFSLGVMLSEMLGEEASQTSRLKPVLGRALAKDREQRYATMKQFGEAIAGVRRSMDPDARGSANRLPNRLQLSLVLAACAALVAAVWFVRSPRATPVVEALAPVPFTSEHGFEYEPRFSPDGARVAYTRSAGFDPEVVLQDIGRPSSPRPIIKDAFSPAWHPRGDAIAVVSSRNENARRDVLMVRLSDLSSRKIATISTPGPFQDWVPSPYIDFSPDGRYIVAADGWTNARSSLVLLPVQTGEKIPLTTAPPAIPGDFSPRFSPDGKSIAFTRVLRFASSSAYVLSLTTAMRPSGSPKLLPSTDLWNSFPVWTSDSRHVLFAGGAMRAARIKLAASDGSSNSITLPVQETAVTTLDAIGTGSGRHRMIYTRFPRNDDIMRVPIESANAEANGSAARPLINSSFVDEHPVYSPDGKSVAFLSDRTGALQVWTAQSDGSSPRQVTTEPSAEFHHLAWSPDGKHLAMQVAKFSESGIYDVPVSGGPLRLLVANDATSPVYSPDGQWLYFASRRSGTARFWRIPAGGGGPEMVPALEGDALCFSPDGRVAVFAKGLKLFMRPASGGPSTLLFPEIYSHQSFVATNAAVYAVARHAERWMLVARRFAEKNDVLLAHFLRQPANGLAVSPDDRFALLTQREAVTLDLMLIDGVSISR